MISIDLLQPGYYGPLQRYPFHNPARGGFFWIGEQRGCNQSVTWVVVDRAVYVDRLLTAVDLRFEQHCELELPALHGQVHWDTSNPTLPPGPIQPPPPDLWKPAAGATPSTGYYLYLESDAGDPVGLGGTYTFDEQLSIHGAVNGASIAVGGWFAYVQAMGGLTDLQPGLYPNVARTPGQNPARGGLLVYDGTRQCLNDIKGWFAVDRVTYTDGALTALDLRFEQHCGTAAPALRGQLHWASP